MRLTILAKSVLTIALLIAFSLTLVGLMLERRERAALEEQAIAKLEAQASLLAGEVAAARLEGDVWARRAATRTRARVTVIASDGRVLADSDEPSSQMDNHATRPEVAQALAGGSGQAVRFSRTVSRDLTYFAQAVARGELSRRLSIRSRDELGDLADALNAMTTDLQETLQRLETEGRRIRTIMESMAEGLLVIDARGRISLVNPAAEALLGIKQETTLAQTPLEAVRSHELDELLKAAAQGVGTASAEVALPYPRRRVLAGTAVAIRDAGGPTGARCWPYGTSPNSSAWRRRGWSSWSTYPMNYGLPLQPSVGMPRHSSRTAWRIVRRPGGSWRSFTDMPNGWGACSTTCWICPTSSWKRFRSPFGR